MSTAALKKLGIAMVGYGGIGRVHAMAYRAIPFHYGLPADRIKIVGVATARLETAEQAAREIGCEHWTNEYAQLLARDDVDIIDCCAPNHVHNEIVTAAAQAGKHIYCEKPLAVNVAEGRCMAVAAKEAAVKTQMTFNFRFFPAITRARQLVAQGFLGQIFSFRGRYYRSSYIDQNKPLSWRLRRETAGGGALFDLGSHVLDLVYFLLGECEAVLATLDTLIKERPLHTGATGNGVVDVDDIALLHLRLADGTLGLIETSRMGTGLPNDLQIEIFGDKGALRFSSAAPSWLEVYDARDDAQPLGGMRGFRKLETVQRHEDQQAPDWSMPPSFVRTHAECQYQFMKAIWEDCAPSPDLSDGLHIQEVMEAAIRSSQQNRWVTMNEIQESE